MTLHAGRLAGLASFWGMSRALRNSNKGLGWLRPVLTEEQSGTCAVNCCEAILLLTRKGWAVQESVQMKCLRQMRQFRNYDKFIESRLPHSILGVFCYDQHLAMGTISKKDTSPVIWFRFAIVYQINVLMRQLKLFTKSVVRIFLHPHQLWTHSTISFTKPDNVCQLDQLVPQMSMRCRLAAVSLSWFRWDPVVVAVGWMELPGRSSHVVPPMCESSEMVVFCLLNKMQGLLTKMRGFSRKCLETQDCMAFFRSPIYRDTFGYNSIN